MLSEAEGGWWAMKRAEFERLEVRRLRRRNAVLVVGALVCVGIYVLVGVLKHLPEKRRREYKAWARNEVVNLRRAVMAYDMEYSKLPVPLGTEEDVRMETDEKTMAILLGGGGEVNPQRLLFYTGKDARKEKSGLLVFDPKLGPRLVDPWGRPFVMIIDGDGDHTVTGPDGTRIEWDVICYSLGEDGVFDAKDPKSW